MGQGSGSLGVAYGQGRRGGASGRGPGPVGAGLAEDTALGPGGGEMTGWVKWEGSGDKSQVQDAGALQRVPAERAALLEKREGPGSPSGSGSRRPGRKAGVPAGSPAEGSWLSSAPSSLRGAPQVSKPRALAWCRCLSPKARGSRKALGHRLSEVSEAGLGLEVSGCSEVLRSPQALA